MIMQSPVGYQHWKNWGWIVNKPNKIVCMTVLYLCVCLFYSTRFLYFILVLVFFLILLLSFSIQFPYIKKTKAKQIFSFVSDEVHHIFVIIDTHIALLYSSLPSLQTIIILETLQSNSRVHRFIHSIIPCDAYKRLFFSISIKKYFSLLICCAIFEIAKNQQDRNLRLSLFFV